MDRLICFLVYVLTALARLSKGLKKLGNPPILTIMALAKKIAGLL